MMIKADANIANGEYPEIFSFTCRVKIENGVVTPIFVGDYTIHRAERDGVVQIFLTRE